MPTVAPTTESPGPADAPIFPINETGNVTKVPADAPIFRIIDYDRVPPADRALPTNHTPILAVPDWELPIPTGATTWPGVVSGGHTEVNGGQPGVTPEGQDTTGQKHTPTPIPTGSDFTQPSELLTSPSPLASEQFTTSSPQLQSSSTRGASLGLLLTSATLPTIRSSASPSHSQTPPVSTPKEPLLQPLKPPAKDELLIVHESTYDLYPQEGSLESLPPSRVKGRFYDRKEAMLAKLGLWGMTSTSVLQQGRMKVFHKGAPLDGGGGFRDKHDLGDRLDLPSTTPSIFPQTTLSSHPPSDATMNTQKSPYQTYSTVFGSSRSSTQPALNTQKDAYNTYSTVFGPSSTTPSAIHTTDSLPGMPTTSPLRVWFTSRRTHKSTTTNSFPNGPSTSKPSPNDTDMGASGGSGQSGSVSFGLSDPAQTSSGISSLERRIGQGDPIETSSQSPLVSPAVLQTDQNSSSSSPLNNPPTTRTESPISISDPSVPRLKSTTESQKADHTNPLISTTTGVAKSNSPSFGRTLTLSSSFSSLAATSNGTSREMSMSSSPSPLASTVSSQFSSSASDLVDSQHGVTHSTTRTYTDNLLSQADSIATTISSTTPPSSSGFVMDYSSPASPSGGIIKGLGSEGNHSDSADNPSDPEENPSDSAENPSGPEENPSNSEEAKLDVSFPGGTSVPPINQDSTSVPNGGSAYTSTTNAKATAAIERTSSGGNAQAGDTTRPAEGRPGTTTQSEFSESPGFRSTLNLGEITIITTASSIPTNTGGDMESRNSMSTNGNPPDLNTPVPSSMTSYSANQRVSSTVSMGGYYETTKADLGGESEVSTTGTTATLSTVSEAEKNSVTITIAPGRSQSPSSIMLLEETGTTIDSNSQKPGTTIVTSENESILTSGHTPAPLPTSTTSKQILEQHEDSSTTSAAILGTKEGIKTSLSSPQAAKTTSKALVDNLKIQTTAYDTDMTSQHSQTSPIPASQTSTGSKKPEEGNGLLSAVPSGVIYVRRLCLCVPLPW